MELDDVIRRLPASGEEWQWDRVRNDGITDPAAEELARRLNAGVKLNDDQWRRALLSTGAIRFHHKWPRHEDYRVSLTVPRWLGIGQIRLDPRAQGMRSIAAGELMVGLSGTFPAMRARDARLGQALGEVPPGTTEITFDVEVERGKSWRHGDDDPEPGILWMGTITAPVELVESFDQIAEPVDNQLMAEAVRDAVGAGIRTWGENQNPVPFVLIDPDTTRFPFLTTTGLDIKVELLEGDEIIEESWLVAGDLDTLALISSIQTGGKRFYGSANLRVPEGNRDTASWLLRLTGCAQHLNALWHARLYWSGTLTLSWDEAVKHEQKRTADAPRGPEMGTPYMK